jgi:hypothetical protein
MNTVDYFRAAAKELHDSLLEAVKDLSKEEILGEVRDLPWLGKQNLYQVIGGGCP